MSNVSQTPGTVKISTYNWEDGSTTYNVQAMDSGQRFRCAISQATEAARKRFPHSNDRIERAYALVTEGKVTLHPASGTATVTSSDGTGAYTVNGVCSCPDAPTKAPEGFCKHRLAVVILRKAVLLVAEWKKATGPITITAAAMDPETVEAVAVETVAETVETETETETETEETVLEAEVVPSVPRIPREFLYDREGTTAIRWGGLLHMAHEKGVLSLAETVTHVGADYVMARGVVLFKDGTTFEGVGDSSPDNVGKLVKPHWRRLAGTRALARALRHGLDIPYVCSVELDD